MSYAEPTPVSHRLDYAVRALVALAHAERAMTAEQISAAEGIPRPYLLALLRELTTAGLLLSRRGRRGGFQLAREPADLTVADVIDAISPDRGPPLPQPDPPKPSLPEVWSAAHDAASGVLRSVSIADLAAPPT